MAKPNYQFEKRQKELVKKNKREEKRQKKAAANSAADDSSQGSQSEAAPVDASTLASRGLA